MDWSDSVFREQPTYYGDIPFSKDHSPVGDDGLAVSAKWMAFRTSTNKIGILSSNFDRNIEEKLAQGRKAEYGSKVFTTIDLPTIDLPTPDTSATVLSFDIFNWNRLHIGDSSGTLTIFDVSSLSPLYDSPSAPSTILSSPIFSSSPVNCLSAHPHTANMVAVGGVGEVRILDLAKNAVSLCSTKMLSADDSVCRLTFDDNANVLRGITNSMSFVFDPRSATEKLESVCKHTFAPCALSNIGGNLCAIAGLTPFVDPILCVLDVRKMVESEYVFKRAFESNRQCRPMLSVDGLTGLLYVAFESCADILALNSAAEFEKQALYHSVDDTVMAMAVAPKNAAKKREINRFVKWGKTRIQSLVHSRGGKPIYSKVSSSQRTSTGTASEYMSNTVLSPPSPTTVLVPSNFTEASKRSVSIFTHIKGIEPNINNKKYFDLKVSKTVTCTLGLNIRRNSKIAAFPAPTFGGGALGIITLANVGRIAQLTLTAHADKIVTFDLCRLPNRLNYVITGSPDGKALLHNVDTEAKTCEKLFTLSCCGKVNCVRFHPRIDGLCVVTANNEQSASSTIYLWNYIDGKVVREIVCEGVKDIADVAFEGSVGLVMAVSSRKGKVILVDVREGKVLRTFSAQTVNRDTRLFWASATRLVCLGFAKGSVRKFEVYDVSEVMDPLYADRVEGYQSTSSESESKDAEEDEKSEWPRRVCEQLLGVSNAVPVGHLDVSRGLLMVSSVGDRKVRVFSLRENGKEMGMGSAFQAKSDIVGLAWAGDDAMDVRRIETAHALALHKDGVVSPISFTIPRKRMEYFQDDVYGEVLDTTQVYGIEVVGEGYDGKVEKVKYRSLKPDGMVALSEAPKEEMSTLQKRRKSNVALMEANKLREQAGSMEQSFDQFSRMVADAPTANRWDAQNIGTEVDDDEWDD